MSDIIHMHDMTGTKCNRNYLNFLGMKTTSNWDEVNCKQCLEQKGKIGLKDLVLREGQRKCVNVRL